MKSPDRDAGFTLIELLITLVIMPIVVGGLVMMLFLVFRAQGGVSNKLSGSSDATVVSAMVSSDVESATAITTESTPACGSTGTQILGVKSSNTGNVASYVLVVNGIKDELFREQCTSTNTTTPFGQTLISSNVPSTLTASVNCAVTCAASTSWVYGASVTQVGLSITETTTGVSYAITAAPRLWSAAGVGELSQEDPYPITPLDILGAGSCSSPSLSLSGNATIVVSSGSGTAQDNSTCTDQISMSGNASITAGSLETGDPTPSTSYTKSGNATLPTPTFATPNGDPFAGLSAPTNPTASGTGTCSSSSSSCTPGTYTAAVSFSGNSTWTVDAGTYVFDLPVTISGNASASFGAGTYLFKEGLDLSGNGTVTFGTGTYIFEATSSTGSALAVSGNGIVSSGAGGVLLYAESGTIDFSGNGDVSLSGLAAYDGISMWQAKTDTNSVTLSGNSGVNDAYGGVYAGGATVVPSGNASVSAAFVVANGVNFGGNSSLSVG